MAERHSKGEDSIYFAHEGACAPGSPVMPLNEMIFINEQQPSTRGTGRLLCSTDMLLEADRPAEPSLTDGSVL